MGMYSMPLQAVTKQAGDPDSGHVLYMGVALRVFFASFDLSVTNWNSLFDDSVLGVKHEG
jgi:hypothetical protein